MTISLCMLSHFSHVWLFCSPLDCSPPGSPVHGILEARILKWVAMPSSRGSSWPRNQTCVSCIAGGFFTTSITWEAHIIVIMGKFGHKHCHTRWTSCEDEGQNQGHAPASPERYGTGSPSKQPNLLTLDLELLASRTARTWFLLF